MMTGLCEVDSTHDSETGEQVALKSVQATGQISGLMLEMTVRQHYCNTSNRNIETVYTLPLAEIALTRMSGSRVVLCT